MILFLVHMDGVLVRPQAAGEAGDKMLTQDAFGVQQLHAAKDPMSIWISSVEANNLP